MYFVKSAFVSMFWIVTLTPICAQSCLTTAIICAFVWSSLGIRIVTSKPFGADDFASSSFALSMSYG